MPKADGRLDIVREIAQVFVALGGTLRRVPAHGEPEKWMELPEKDTGIIMGAAAYCARAMRYADYLQHLRKLTEVTDADAILLGLLRSYHDGRPMEGDGIFTERLADVERALFEMYVGVRPTDEVLALTETFCEEVVIRAAEEELRLSAK